MSQTIPSTPSRPASSAPAGSQRLAPPALSNSLALWSAATILLSAFLLFQVQPVISKKILPWFGGSPAVWTTCVLFLQLVLLGGYAYAHLLTHQVKSRWQAIAHLAIGLAAVGFLMLFFPPSA